MTSVEDLARTIRDAANAGLRVTQGTVVEVVDTTHVRVDLGDRVITAYRPATIPAGTGSAVRLLVGGNTTEILSAGTGGWTAPTLGNGWVDFLAGVAPTAYRRVGDVVELRGAIKSGTVNTTVFTLPTGARPTAGIEIFAVVAGAGGARLDVSTDGTVTVRSYFSSGSKSMVTLSGVRFSV